MHTSRLQVEQIVEILNHHLDSLQWLDSNATQLENRYARIGGEGQGLEPLVLVNKNAIGWGAGFGAIGID